MIAAAHHTFQVMSNFFGTQTQQPICQNNFFEDTWSTSNSNAQNNNNFPRCLFNTTGTMWQSNHSTQNLSAHYETGVGNHNKITGGSFERFTGNHNVFQNTKFANVVGNHNTFTNCTIQSLVGNHNKGTTQNVIPNTNGNYNSVSQSFEKATVRDGAKLTTQSSNSVANWQPIAIYCKNVVVKDHNEILHLSLHDQNRAHLSDATHWQKLAPSVVAAAQKVGILWPESFEEIQTDDEKSQCSICMENKKSACIFDCGHLTCCVKCLKNHVLVQSVDTDTGTCPVCRTKITKVVRVFD